MTPPNQGQETPDSHQQSSHFCSISNTSGGGRHRVDKRHKFVQTRSAPFSRAMQSFIIAASCAITILFYVTSSTLWSIQLIKLSNERGNSVNTIPIPARPAGFDERINKLEARAMTILDEGEREGMSHAVPPQVHYTVTKFQLSVGHSSSFTFTVQNAEDVKLKWMDLDSYESLTGGIICYMDRIGSLNMNHIPHFSQVAFPCWSILQRFPNANRCLQLRNIDLEDLTSEWIMDLLQVFRDAGIQVLEDGHANADEPLAAAKRNVRRRLDYRNNTETRSSDWIATLNKVPSGGFPQKQPDSKFPIQNSRYFSTHSDVQTLQRYVLGDEYKSVGTAVSLPLRVLLIDRAGGSREWSLSNDTASLIEKVWGDDVHVKVVSNFHGSLRDQALEMHNADIIISPHGAQLTNLAFIRPCTAVLELFPRGYYLGYFQPLVLSAGGVSFDGYPFDRSPLLDTDGMVSDEEQRVMIRELPIKTSPESIMRAFPKLVTGVLSCRRGKAFEENE